MTLSQPVLSVTVGVLALQGAFSEHVQLLRAAAASFTYVRWKIIEVRTPSELDQCDALIIPGGESTAISLVAERSSMLEPLRTFVKVLRKPVWGTCAGLILLSESANRTKKGGQELIGGLDVRINRNHFGRQVESFEADLVMPFLSEPRKPFRSVFIRAPVVEKILPHVTGIQSGEAAREKTVVAPSKTPQNEAAEKRMSAEVEVMCRLPGRARTLNEKGVLAEEVGDDGDIVAVRQGNCFGTSFHPELADDKRIHVWWLGEVLKSIEMRRV
ncbi:pyridoxal 5'-phosphate synthase, glutaminase subunit Pdx2 [Verruconis gallopava]|uniref:glutaminase n=1 Tax=Verruconis gallopava TaxID=253628 RepID=A0A0D2ADX4_9PEZI|nr:pyridoxal 5'-phosphate synthase, glutaminase subunit Pdx2 [Verruconis gallopava]KIW04665.1 pyridoxal 5'-phosphate synthase, glutaminase subunit Pdx2 [Verruconis gallopava]